MDGQRQGFLAQLCVLGIMCFFHCPGSKENHTFDKPMKTEEEEKNRYLNKLRLSESVQAPAFTPQFNLLFSLK